MAHLLVPLLLTPGADSVWLRSLSGMDELAIHDTSTAGLLRVLESLIQKDTMNTSISAAQIVTADRDRLLASLYISLYGAKVDSTVTCEKCNERFDLNFSLHDLMNHLLPNVSKHDTYQLEPGVTFRLPTGEDELFIYGLAKPNAAQMLLKRCLLEGDPEVNSELVQKKMSEMAPVLNLEMEAVCPECNSVHLVQFDIQSFLLTKLRQERPLLIHEIHSIASTYHWTQQEILDLPRSIRKQYAALIQSEN